MARRRAPAITAEERERLQRESRELARARSVADAAAKTIEARAWLAADGRRSILAIAALLQQQGTGEVAQVEPRLAKFFAMLARDGFSGWKDSDK